MGKVVKAVTKPIKKVVKSVVSAGTDAIKSVAKGDIGGLADAATRAASMGTISLGDKGLLNAGLTSQPKQLTQMPTAAQDEAEGLLNYVSDLKNRKSRRSRSSTNNTGGASAADGNKLSGTTALGV